MEGKERARRVGRRRAEALVRAVLEAGIVEVAESLLEQARKGDVRSQLEVIGRVLGRPAERRERAADEAAPATLRIIIEDGAAAAAPDQGR